ncbi:MAG: UDP-N-acetylmuramate--L-alanine ligase [Acutalibacteraceae bacterium]|nr:UDP-N-acetylmuramate--L-alanine ligase [Acutalibacteraceae bacterium]
MKELRSEDKILSKVKRIHMIGIGGSGMCPLAQILQDKGYEITGSDNNESEPLSRIKKLGIKVTMGHFAESVRSCELVVYSAAISKDNPELVEADRLGIPTMERSVLLGALTRYYDNVIGVCGTHGKTSVTSMITQILYLNKMDPTAVIGGKLPILNSNGRIGKSETMVCEACEFVDTFLKMSPDISVLLNIDNDHLDYFKTMDNLILSFHKFISMSKLSYINGDDKLSLKAAEGIDAQIITFGMDSSNDYYANNIVANKRGYSFDVCNKEGTIGRIDMCIPGRHNVYNALAAFAVCYDLGVSVNGIKDALQKFTGAGRRFEFLGEYGGFMLADDYAHHPTEIKATLSAAKALPYNKVTCIFQPFTFSRTALLKDEFVDALSLADEVILTQIMGSREVNTYSVSSEQIAEKLNNARVIDTFDEIADYIFATAKEGNIVITMGGGDIYKAAHKIIAKYN